MYLVDLPQTRPFSASSPVPEVMDKKVPWICTSTGENRSTRHPTLLLGLAVAMRRSELVGLDVADLTFTRDSLVLTLRRSRSNQEGRDTPQLPAGQSRRYMPRTRAHGTRPCVLTVFVW